MGPCKSGCTRGCPRKRAWLELEAGWRGEKEGSEPMAAAAAATEN